MKTSFRTALVTGATGFIGSALTKRLVEEGIRVFCLVRKSSQNVSRLMQDQRIEVIELSTSAEQNVRDALNRVNADIVFNLASYGVNPAHVDPSAMIDGNIRLLKDLLIAVDGRPLRQFIHIGTCSEYAPKSAHIPIKEEHPLRPMSLYGASKAASELIGSVLAARLKIPFVTLRLFGVYGNGEASYRLIPYLIEKLTHGEPVDLTPGEQVRDLLFIDDVVNALLKAGECLQPAPFEVYNVCSGNPVQVRAIGKMVAELLHKPQTLLLWGKRTYRPDEPLWLVGSNDCFVRATGWRPLVPLGEGLKRMIEEGSLHQIAPEGKKAIEPSHTHS